MKKYVIKVRKKTSEVAVIAASFEEAVEEAKERISFYDFSVPEAYEFIDGREATEEDIEKFDFGDED